MLKSIKLTNNNVQDVVDFIKENVDVISVSEEYSNKNNIDRIHSFFYYKDKKNRQRADVSVHLNEYIVLDKGNLFEATEEELEKYQLKRKYNFDRKKNKIFYYIDEKGNILDCMDIGSNIDKTLHYFINYFEDRETAKNFNRVQFLQRQLLKYSLENRGNEINWENPEQYKYKIVYSTDTKKFESAIAGSLYEVNQIYFISEEVTQNAIVAFHDELHETLNLHW